MSGGQDDASNDIESSSGNTIKCPHCSETLDYDERGRNWLCERCGILWSTTKRCKLPVGLREIEMTEAATKQIEDMLAAEPTQPIVEPRDMHELHSVEWAKEVFELQRLLKACDGNPVLALQLKSRLEELNPYPTWGQENDVLGVSNFQAEIERELCEGIGELVDEMKNENDVEEELDLSKPCEVRISKQWITIIGIPFYDQISQRYGCYYRDAMYSAFIHTWANHDGIRNSRSPQYEQHTMQSLLPLANEWVHHIDDSNCFPFNRIADDEVEVDRMVLPYKRLADKYVWATGPDKGKPVAREVG
jgi:ribosomal protein L37AE/L43A